MTVFQSRLVLFFAMERLLLLVLGAIAVLCRCLCGICTSLSAVLRGRFFLSQEEEIRRNQMKLEMISHLHASTTITGGYECWNALSNNVLHCAWELCWAPSGEGRTQSLILIAEPSAGRANQRVANRAHWSVWIIKYYWNLLNIVEYHGILNMAQNSRILNIDCGKHCL